MEAFRAMSVTVSLCFDAKGTTLVVTLILTRIVRVEINTASVKLPSRLLIFIFLNAKVDSGLLWHVTEREQVLPAD